MMVGDLDIVSSTVPPLRSSQLPAKAFRNATANRTRLSLCGWFILRVEEINE